VFHGNRWAGAFVSAAGGNADPGIAGQALACLKAIAPAVKTMPGALFGRIDAAKFEKMLRECADFSGLAQTANAPAIEYAIRLISLLVEKNCFRYIDSVLQKIEDLLNEQEGIIDVSVESAIPMDSGLEEELKRMIKECYGAAGIKMKTVITPDLLGGYRLRVGGYCIDASLKGQLEQMKADLVADGGKNGEL